MTRSASKRVLFSSLMMAVLGSIAVSDETEATIHLSVDAREAPLNGIHTGHFGGEHCERNDSRFSGRVF